MRYLVLETCNGELFRDIWVFNDPVSAFKFIESCAFATDRRQWLESPVVEAVNDHYQINQYDRNRSIRLFHFKENSDA